MSRFEQEVICYGFNHPDSIRVIYENDLYLVQIYCGENGWNSMGNGCKTDDYAQDVIDSIVEFVGLNGGKF